jgi:hypothetical protein
VIPNSISEAGSGTVALRIANFIFPIVSGAGVSISADDRWL